VSLGQTNQKVALWELQASYDSADACQAAIVRLLKFHDKNEKDDPSRARFYQLQELRLGEAHCIATDDPRLKGK
jgi:hypothetical protein